MVLCCFGAGEAAAPPIPGQPPKQPVVPGGAAQPQQQQEANKSEDNPLSAMPGASPSSVKAASARQSKDVAPPWKTSKVCGA